MKPLTVAIPYSPAPLFAKLLLALTKLPPVERVIIVAQEPVHVRIPGSHILTTAPITAQVTLEQLLAETPTGYLLLLPRPLHVVVEAEALDRMLKAAQAAGAGMVYSDFYDESKHGKTLHPLNDYQPGSVRDDFDFGPMALFSVPWVKASIRKHGTLPGIQFAGLYDLRLKLTIDHPIHHLREPLYSVIGSDEPTGSEKLFAYVDPRNQAVQTEMEAVFTDYLKRIGAYLPPLHLRRLEPGSPSFPVEASVIIPVRNRKGTIAEAAQSALSQETDFPFNVIVVDNHSTDGTTAVLADLAKAHSRLKHIIPVRTDLGIGGCWNEALHDHACGRYSVQLDSDDLYISDRTLQRMVDMLRQDKYAMVVGSYTLVNERLEEIPPGLVDHREWTDENGHNNALRINGLGAPRAFHTGIMRAIGFLNVSYGEDYAAALRICREYRIGRIYESLYLCRRWSGNTDAALDIEAANKNDAFKDGIRTAEIIARQKMNQNNET
jgi:Glycosyl transferase family 2